MDTVLNFVMLDTLLTKMTDLANNVTQPVILVPEIYQNHVQLVKTHTSITQLMDHVPLHAQKDTTETPKTETVTYVTPNVHNVQAHQSVLIVKKDTSYISENVEKSAQMEPTKTLKILLAQAVTLTVPLALLLVKTNVLLAQPTPTYTKKNVLPHAQMDIMLHHPPIHVTHVTQHVELVPEELITLVLIVNHQDIGIIPNVEKHAHQEPSHKKTQENAQYVTQHVLNAQDLN